MDALAIWNKGVLLSDAHRYIGPPEKVKTYRQYAAQASKESILNRIQDNIDSGVTGWDILKDVTGPKTPKADLEREIRGHIVTMARQKKLLAYGYALPRRPDDNPIAIPLDLWETFVHWDKNRLEANGLRIESVRLTLPSWIEEDLASEEILRSAGRPSRSPQIIAAFRALSDGGQLDFDKPASHSYPAVRKWVQAHYPDDVDPKRGLSDKALEKHFNPLFMERRNTLYRD